MNDTNDLVPPDEIHVPFQTAVDLDVLALEGVITNEHKFLLATAEREAADAMEYALSAVKNDWEYNNHEITFKTMDFVTHALALADDKKDGG